MARDSIDLLSTKQQGLLFALLLFGSRDIDKLLSHLEDDLAARIKKFAEERLSLDRNARIQLAVSGLERLFTQERQSSLVVIEPSWITHLMQQEDPILAKLYQAKPASEILTQALENYFAPMPFESIGPVMKLEYLIRLSLEDLESLVVQLGQLYLATAFSQLGLQHTALFLAHYDATLQNDLLTQIKAQKAGDFMNLDDAKLFLTAVFARFPNVNSLIKRAGLFALSETLHSTSKTLLRSIAQRFHRNDGRLIIDFALQLDEHPLSSSEIEKRKNTIFQISIERFFTRCTISGTSH